MGEQDHVLHRQRLRVVHLSTLPASAARAQRSRSILTTSSVGQTPSCSLSCSVALSKCRGINQMTSRSQEPHDVSQLSTCHPRWAVPLVLTVFSKVLKTLLVETSLLSEMIQITLIFHTLYFNRIINYSKLKYLRFFVAWSITRESAATAFRISLRKREKVAFSLLHADIKCIPELIMVRPWLVASGQCTASFSGHA